MKKNKSKKRSYGKKANYQKRKGSGRRTRKKGGLFPIGKCARFTHTGERRPPRPQSSEEIECCRQSSNCRSQFPKLYPNVFNKIKNAPARGVGAIRDAIKSQQKSNKYASNEKNAIANEAKLKQIYNYHKKRTKHKEEKEGIYGSSCKSTYNNPPWGMFIPRMGKADYNPGYRGGVCDDELDLDGEWHCSKPWNNYKGIIMPNKDNWLAPPEAFNRPSPDYRPGIVDEEGLVCRPDHQGEWCRLDPVAASWWSSKKNDEQSNKQTCLTPAHKNLKASSLSALAAGRLLDYDSKVRAIERAWGKDPKNPINIHKERERKKKIAKERKKKLVTDKVQAQAHAFAEKEKGNNAEFFNAEDEEIFFNAQSGGRRKTRRKRGGRPYRGFKRADIVILTGAGVAHETELGRNNANDWVGTVTDSYDGGWSVRENPGMPGIARVTVRWENRGGFIKNQNYSNVVLGADYFTNAHPIEFIYKRPPRPRPGQPPRGLQNRARKTTAYQNLGNLHTSKVAKQELDSNLPLGHAILGGRRRKRRRSRRKKRTRRKKMRRK